MLGKQEKIDFKEGLEVDCFICPLSSEVMLDPVITPSGKSYERKHIERWVADHAIDPCTEHPLDKSQLISNLDLKRAIFLWKQFDKEWEKHAGQYKLTAEGVRDSSSPASQQESRYPGEVAQGSSSSSSVEGHAQVAQTQVNTDNKSSILQSSIFANKEQMTLQNQLTDACYSGDLLRVKELVEKGADLRVPDVRGKLPIVKAIRGMAFGMLEYLESEINYSKEDWQNIKAYFQNENVKPLSFSPSIKTFQALITHHEQNTDAYIYHYAKLEKIRKEAINTCYASRDFLDAFKRPLTKGKVLSKAVYKRPIRGKNGPLLEVHSCLSGKQKITYYAWEKNKQLNKIGFGRDGGSISLLWMLSSMMRTYLYNKDIHLEEDGSLCSTEAASSAFG